MEKLYIVKTTDRGTSDYNHNGRILTMLHDDGSAAPIYEEVSTGRQLCLWRVSVVPYKQEPLIGGE